MQQTGLGASKDKGGRGAWVRVACFDVQRLVLWIARNLRLQQQPELRYTDVAEVALALRSGICFHAEGAAVPEEQQLARLRPPRAIDLLVRPDTSVVVM